MVNKVLVSASHFDTLCKDAWKLLEENGLEVVFDKEKEFPAYTTEEIQNLREREEIVAALIGMDDFRDERKFEALPNLKAVAKFGVGIDNIDVAFAEKYGVKVLNAPGQNSNSVAELTICLMLDLLRQVVPLHCKVEKGLWPRYMGTEIKNKTVGLIGFGAIARLVAKKLKAFDAKILAYDMYPNEELARDLGVKLTDFETVIQNSDIISVHIPATSETYHLFGKDVFRRMKEGAYFVNTARGALADLDALADSLSSGHLAGAAIDAFEKEPLSEDTPILKCENVILTPHTGGETKEAYYNISMKTAGDIVKVCK